MDHSKETQQICSAYNMQPNEIIFCFAIAAGADPGDSFKICFKNNNIISHDLAIDKANSYLSSTPAAKVLINRIKNKKIKPDKETQKQLEQENIKELSSDEMNEFKTRDGLIEKIINSVPQTAGKDKANVLINLAKLQGYDKPNENEKEDHRQYYLPYISDCKRCKLMQIYRDLAKNQD